MESYKSEVTIPGHRLSLGSCSNFSTPSFTRLRPPDPQGCDPASMGAGGKWTKGFRLLGKSSLQAKHPELLDSQGQVKGLVVGGIASPGMPSPSRPGQSRRPRTSPSTRPASARLSVARPGSPFPVSSAEADLIRARMSSSLGPGYGPGWIASGQEPTRDNKKIILPTDNVADQKERLVIDARGRAARPGRKEKRPASARVAAASNGLMKGITARAKTAEAGHVRGLEGSSMLPHQTTREREPRGVNQPHRGHAECPGKRGRQPKRWFMLQQVGEAGIWQPWSGAALSPQRDMEYLEGFGLGSPVEHLNYRPSSRLTDYAAACNTYRNYLEFDSADHDMLSVSLDATASYTSGIDTCMEVNRVVGGLLTKVKEQQCISVSPMECGKEWGEQPGESKRQLAHGDTDGKESCSSHNASDEDWDSNDEAGEKWGAAIMEITSENGAGVESLADPAVGVRSLGIPSASILEDCKEEENAGTDAEDGKDTQSGGWYHDTTRLGASTSAPSFESGQSGCRREGSSTSQGATSTMSSVLSIGSENVGSTEQLDLHAGEHTRSLTGAAASIMSITITAKGEDSIEELEIVDAKENAPKGEPEGVRQVETADFDSEKDHAASNRYINQTRKHTKGGLQTSTARHRLREPELKTREVRPSTAFVRHMRSLGYLGTGDNQTGNPLDRDTYLGTGQSNTQLNGELTICRASPEPEEEEGILDRVRAAISAKRKLPMDRPESNAALAYQNCRRKADARWDEEEFKNPFRGEWR
ncbi:unnamed protein product [Chrysoparadoxa australica]